MYEFPAFRTSTLTFSANNVASWPSKRNFFASAWNFNSRFARQVDHHGLVRFFSWTFSVVGSLGSTLYPPSNETHTKSMRLLHDFSNLVESVSLRWRMSLCDVSEVVFAHAYYPPYERAESARFWGAHAMRMPCAMHFLKASSSNPVLFSLISCCVVARLALYLILCGHNLEFAMSLGLSLV